MTVIVNKKLDIKRLIIDKIKIILFDYKSRFNIDEIFFNQKIDGFSFINLKLYSCVKLQRNSMDEISETNYDWTRIEGKTLIKILRCLITRDIYGHGKLSNGKVIRINPKK